MSGTFTVPPSSSAGQQEGNTQQQREAPDFGNYQWGERGQRLSAGSQGSSTNRVFGSLPAEVTPPTAAVAYATPDRQHLPIQTVAQGQQIQTLQPPTSAFYLGLPALPGSSGISPDNTQGRRQFRTMSMGVGVYRPTDISPSLRGRHAQQAPPQELRYTPQGAPDKERQNSEAQQSETSSQRRRSSTMGDFISRARQPSLSLIEMD